MNSNHPPPLLEGGHLEAPRFEAGRWRAPEFVLDLPDAPPGRAFTIEPIGGEPPIALTPVWSAVATVEDGALRVPLADDVAVPPFGVAVRVRPRPADPSLGEAPPSNIVWVSNASGSAAPRGDGSERTLFVLLAGVLGLLAHAYRKATDGDSRVRLAAVGAVLGAIVLLATSGMPWMQGAVAGLECRLGQEALCAAPPLATLAEGTAGRALFDFERWRAGADAIHLAQLVAFALLLPALIWLLVEPRARPAQATALVGATIAGFGFLAVAFYRLTMPGWLVADLYATFDVALLASAAIVAAVGGIVRQVVVLDGVGPPIARVVRG